MGKRRAKSKQPSRPQVSAQEQVLPSTSRADNLINADAQPSSLRHKKRLNHNPQSDSSKLKQKGISRSGSLTRSNKLVNNKNDKALGGGKQLRSKLQTLERKRSKTHTSRSVSRDDIKSKSRKRKLSDSQSTQVPKKFQKKGKRKNNLAGNESTVAGTSTEKIKGCMEASTSKKKCSNITTRAQRAKEIGKTRFVFDKVCACDEKHQYMFVVGGNKLKGCHCGKVTEQFLKLTGGSDISTCTETRAWKNRDMFSRLSIEIMCYIFRYLGLKDLLRMETMSTKIQKAVHASFKLVTEIDFMENITDHTLFEDGLCKLTNWSLMRLMSKLPKVKNIYNFHPASISKNAKSSTNGPDDLSTMGIVTALMSSKTLNGIEISSLQLLEVITKDLPHVTILGRFTNQNRVFPTGLGRGYQFKEESKITSLHLVGCKLWNLPSMDLHLEHLYLRFVHFTSPQPFNLFYASKLKTFVMAHCIGPASALKYIPLLTSLAEATSLSRLELQRVPFLGGVLQHIVDDNWQSGGFRRLATIVMGACKNALDVDLGFLIIAAAAYLETLQIQPSLTRDAFFTALSVADITVNPAFEKLCLGWTDTFPDKDKINPSHLTAEGFADGGNALARITDSGMKLVSQIFPNMKTLEISSCPHLHNPILWLSPGQQFFSHVSELVLRDCHALKLEKMYVFLTFLPSLEYLTLQDMFREPPKGCSRVGLSAGKGLGAATALINPPNPNGAADVFGNNAAENDLDNDQNGEGQHHDNQEGNENEGEANDGNQPENQANGASRYSFRNSTPRSVNGSRSGEENGASSSRSRNTRKSARSSTSAQSNATGPSCSTADSNGRRTRSVAMETESCPEMSHNNGSQVISKRGKALVTKKGLVCKVKSRKSDVKEVSENSEDSSPSEIPCTCKRETREIGCQVNCVELGPCRHGKKLRRSRRKFSKDKTITAGKFKPALTPATLPTCQKHRNKKVSKPVMCHKSDSTSDPVWEEDETRVMVILHGRLKYAKLDNVGITKLEITGYNLKTLSMSRCRVLKQVTFKEAPYLEKVHVSQCPKFDEVHLMLQLQKLPPNRSKFISLRPMHDCDEKSLFTDVMYGEDSASNNFGTLMMFDYSETPSQTNYNKLRMKSWMNMLERLTLETIQDHGWSLFHSMEEPNKSVNRHEGHSLDGSKWTMFTDVPWICMLESCPDMEPQFMTDPEWRKEGVYCMEAKGHFAFWDAYSDIQLILWNEPHDQIGLYTNNILVYVNMCDRSGVPNEDALGLV